MTWHRQSCRIQTANIRLPARRSIVAPRAIESHQQETYPRKARKKGKKRHDQYKGHTRKHKKTHKSSEHTGKKPKAAPCWSLSRNGALSSTIIADVECAHAHMCVRVRKEEELEARAHGKAASGNIGFSKENSSLTRWFNQFLLTDFPYVER